MSFLNAPFSEWSPFLFILLAGALPTQIWRWSGALFARKLNEESELFRWIKAVATALVAGLIANLIVFPSGVLADYPLWLRLGSVLIGVAVYIPTRPNIIWGILAGEAAFILGGLIFT